MSANNTNKIFDAKSPGFWVTVLTAILSAAATGGIEFNVPVGDLANNLVSTFDTSGLYAVLGIVVVNIAGPVYNFMRKKIPFSWSAILGSTTTWVSLGSIAVSALVLFWGFEIPANTPADVAAAIAARNWGLLGSLAVVAILIPLIRGIKALKAKNSDPG